MRQPLYLTYFAEETGRRWGLSIHLDPGSQDGSDAVWLRDLHAAADRWRQDHPEVFLRSDLAVGPAPGLPRGFLPGYLYASGQVNGDRLARHLSMLRTQGRMHRFAIRPGALAEGVDLVGREEIVDSLLSVLQADTSCHLRAPRRYGKSSVLLRLARELGDRQRPYLLVDVSDSRSISDFLLSVARAAAPLCASDRASLPELSRWPSVESGILEQSRASQELQRRIAENPWSFAGRLFSALGRLRAILILDEFSVFLRSTVGRDPFSTRQLLAALAKSRRDGEPTIQIFAGSAGLTSYIRFHDLGSEFDGVKSIDLPPLTATAAALLAEELLYGESMAPLPEVVERMLVAIGEPIPYFIHVLADAMKEVSDSPLTPGSVDAAYTRRVLGDRGNNIFRIYRVSDQPYPEDLRRAAAVLLRETARSAQGATEESLHSLYAETASTQPDRFSDLLACLQEDYDLVLSGGRWRMRGKVLRDRWVLAEPWLTEAEAS